MIDLILGVDVGTSTTKAVLFSLEGHEIARASSQPYRNFTPQPGWVEQDPEEIWQALITVIKTVVKNAPQPPHILSLCLSVQSGSLISVNDSGEPITPLITWLDGRAEEIVSIWKQQGQQEWVKSESGWSLYPSLCLPTIAWFKKYQSDIFANTTYFLSLNDFLIYRLCGQFFTNPSNAGGMQLLNIQTAEWSQALLNFAGIHEKQLSKVMPSGAVLGHLLPSICDQTGLTVDTKLVNGGHDQVCTALGMGINEPGRWLLAGGTAWVFTGILDSLHMESVPDSLDLNFHAIPQRWTVSRSLGGLGASLEWWLSQAYRQYEHRSDLFEVLNRELHETCFEPQLCFLPLTGGHADPATTRRGSFTGMLLSHQRADFARAIMLGAAYELKWAFESVRISQMPVDHIWMTGGAAASQLWPQIIADAIGIPISLPQYDNWSALGAAILGGMAVNAFESLSSALEKFHKTEKVIYPDETMRQAYLSGYEHYKSLSRLLQ